MPHVILLLFLATVDCFIFINDDHDKNCSSLRNVSQTVSLSKVGSWLSQCPPWFAPDNFTGICLPGPSLDRLIEQDLSMLQTRLLHCYCMTEENGILSVGFCIHKCVYKQGFAYSSLPCNASELGNWSCPSYLKRHGYLCSKCEKDHGIPVYSYSTQCVECKNCNYNWLKYLAAAYVPLTLFYIFVAIFSINFTSPKLSGVVLLFQIIGNPFMLSGDSKFLVHDPYLKVAITFAALWNLDFFRAFYSFCLNPSASLITISELEFLLAIFPFVLIGTTFLLVKLYDRNFKPLVSGWNFISSILKPVRRNIRTSLVEVFASFIYLSCSRLLLTSMYVLLPSITYSYHQTTSGEMVLIRKYRLMFSPSVEYFGTDHLPLALLAIVVSTAFFTIPVILLFIYPLLCCQRALNRFGWNSLTLRTFMDIFQGSYKDGTNGTKDYRFFSGFMLLVPMILYLTFILTKFTLFYTIGGVWVLIYLTLHLTFKPFKSATHNYTMIVMLTTIFGILLCLASNVVTLNLQYFRQRFIWSQWILLVIWLSLPFVYVCGLLLKRQLKNKCSLVKCVGIIKYYIF